MAGLTANDILHALSMSNPVTMPLEVLGATPLGTSAADYYSGSLYGTIPTPVSPNIAPAAPQTATQMDVLGQWTPYDATIETPQQWAERIRAQLAAAEADGSWSPNGTAMLKGLGPASFPLPAWVWWTAAGLGVLVLVAVIKK